MVPIRLLHHCPHPCIPWSPSDCPITASIPWSPSLHPITASIRASHGPHPAAPSLPPSLHPMVHVPGMHLCCLHWGISRALQPGMHFPMDTPTTAGIGPAAASHSYSILQGKPPSSPGTLMPTGPGRHGSIHGTRSPSLSSFPPVPFNLWSRYSKVTLMTWTMARMREPKASEPVWYLGANHPA